MVVLITGKAGAGKTTYGTRYASELEKRGERTKLLDGDAVRHLCKNADYSHEGRTKNLQTIAKMASVFEGQGYTVLVSAVSPTKKLREMMRTHWSKHRTVYIPGGRLWPGTSYEMPDESELS